MSKIELLPCPFCGGKVKLDEDENDYFINAVSFQEIEHITL